MFMNHFVQKIYYKINIDEEKNVRPHLHYFYFGSSHNMIVWKGHYCPGLVSKHH